MQTSADPDEIAKFDRMAADWWDPTGPMAPLHAMSPCRLDYIASQAGMAFGRRRSGASAFAGLSLLDIGCGGGLTAEPMARLGFEVTGIDPSREVHDAAQRHAAAEGLSIDYRVAGLDDIDRTFDVVLALEVVEHVEDPASFLQTAAQRVRPGGLMIVTTLNRTAKSFALAIVGAEFVLGWLPRGTHDWRRFLTPSEVSRIVEAGGLHVVDRTGMVADPARGGWRLSPRDLSVNYAVSAIRA